MKKIFVGNVDFSITKAQLRALFQPYGAIDSISVVTARDTGQPCACGFVEMADSAAEQAIASLNGTESGGRSLIVKEARPKVEPGGAIHNERDDERSAARGQPRW